MVAICLPRSLLVYGERGIGASGVIVRGHLARESLRGGGPWRGSVWVVCRLDAAHPRQTFVKGSREDPFSPAPRGIGRKVPGVNRSRGRAESPCTLLVRILLDMPLLSSRKTMARGNKISYSWNILA